MFTALSTSILSTLLTTSNELSPATPTPFLGIRFAGPDLYRVLDFYNSAYIEPIGTTTKGHPSRWSSPEMDAVIEKLRNTDPTDYEATVAAGIEGLKIAVTYGIVSATIGEWVGGSQGLGLYMLRSRNALRIDQVFAGMLVTTLLSMALYGAAVAAERRAMPWRRAS